MLKCNSDHNLERKDDQEDTVTRRMSEVWKRSLLLPLSSFAEEEEAAAAASVHLMTSKLIFKFTRIKNSTAYAHCPKCVNDHVSLMAEMCVSVCVYVLCVT